MATKNTSSPAPANLSLVQMQDAIPKIERRLADVNAFDVTSIKERSDPRIKTLETSLKLLLQTVFGQQTIEYHNHVYLTQIDTAGYNMNGTPIHEVLKGLHTGKERAIAGLETIKKHFEEELGDAGHSSGGKALRAYEGLDLHPEINRAVSKLYQDGHYANAVEDGVKVLNDLVRMRSGVSEDGVSLMQRVFSPKNPILKFNDLKDESDANEQLGFMNLFCGVVSGLRNPRAHKIIKDDSERALEFIAMISLLAKLLDDAQK